MPGLLDRGDASTPTKEITMPNLTPTQQTGDRLARACDELADSLLVASLGRTGSQHGPRVPIVEGGES